MGFFDVLGKIVYGMCDFVATSATLNAQRLDRMTDEEIEKKYSKPADEVRMEADTLRSQAEIWKTARNKHDDDYIN